LEAEFVLITGRTARQGIGLVLGKDSPEYIREAGTVEISRADLQKMGLKSGDRAVIRSASRSVPVICREADLPGGIIFMPYGPQCNALVDTATHGTGMPDSKGFRVTLSACGYNECNPLSKE
jgi:formylmethanofuran dehydrogenase subunit D